MFKQRQWKTLQKITTPKTLFICVVADCSHLCYCIVSGRNLHMLVPWCSSLTSLKLPHALCLGAAYWLHWDWIIIMRITMSHVYSFTCDVCVMLPKIWRIMFDVARYVTDDLCYQINERYIMLTNDSAILPDEWWMCWVTKWVMNLLLQGEVMNVLVTRMNISSYQMSGRFQGYEMRAQLASACMLVLYCVLCEFP